MFVAYQGADSHAVRKTLQNFIHSTRQKSLFLVKFKYATHFQSTNIVHVSLEVLDLDFVMQSKWMPNLGLQYFYDAVRCL